MLRKIIGLSLLFVLLFSLNACEKPEKTLYDGQGKRPIYVSKSALLDIKSEPPQPIQQSGTIFLQDTLLFILEQGQGIHVFSFQDSVHTTNLAFFKIPAITDFTVSGTTLYADSWNDLVAINISNLQQISETSRISDVISPILYPPLYDGYFECVDESRGAVVGWEDAELSDAKCMTTN